MSVATPVTGDLTVRRSRAEELSALAALFVLTIRQHTHGRRMIVLGLLYALPCALAVLLRSLARPAPADHLELGLVLHLVPHGLAPLTALLYATGVIQDEVEEQTLTYLMVRSVPRWALYVTKLAATLCVTTLLVAIGTALLYVAIYWRTPDLLQEVLLSRAPRVIAVFALAQVGYCALFAFLGLFARRSIITGVIYIVAIEGVLANLDFVARSFTVVYYVRVLLLRWIEFPDTILRACQRDWRINLDLVGSARDCALTLFGFGLVVTVLTSLWFARREYRVKTPEGN